MIEGELRASRQGSDALGASKARSPGALSDPLLEGFQGFCEPSLPLLGPNALPLQLLEPCLGHLVLLGSSLGEILILSLEELQELKGLVARALGFPKARLNPPESTSEGRELRRDPLELLQRSLLALAGFIPLPLGGKDLSN